MGFYGEKSEEETVENRNKNLQKEPRRTQEY